MNRKKMRGLLRDIEGRAARTANAMRDGDRERVGRTVCAVINTALQSHNAFGQQRWASLVRGAVTDRSQLRQLDYWIARIVLRVVTGETRVRAFRQVSYRKIRQEWGLISLLHARNRSSR